MWFGNSWDEEAKTAAERRNQPVVCSMSAGTPKQLRRMARGRISHSGKAKLADDDIWRCAKINPAGLIKLGKGADSQLVHPNKCVRL
jgi:hypothetical protein